MGKRLSVTLVGVLAASLGACGTRSEPVAASVSAPDSGSHADAGIVAPGEGSDGGGVDAGVQPDAGTPDAGTPDGGGTDARVAPIGPHVFAAGEAAQALALDSTNVYWVNDTGAAGSYRYALRTIPKGGGTATTLAEGDGQVNDLVADDEAVFLAVRTCSSSAYVECSNSTDSIVRVAKSNGARLPLATGTGQLAIDDDWVYYLLIPASGGTGEIRRVPKAGGPYQALVRFERLYLPALTVFGDRLYWVGSDERDGHSYGTLRAAAKDGGNAVTIAGGYSMRMKADFDFLYLRTFGDGSVVRLRRGSGADARSIRSPQSASYRDDVDANAGVVYWNESKNERHPGCLARANSDGSDVRCLDQGDFDLRAVRVDDTAVYYVKDGQVWRILK